MTRPCGRIGRVLCVFALLAGATAAHAENVQISPFAGYQFGGSFVVPSTGQGVSIDSSLSYGGTIDFKLSPSWRGELLYSRQSTTLSSVAGGSFLGGGFPMTIERYMGGFVEETGEGKARWFGALLAGATRFVPGLSGSSSDTRFAASFGLGLKYFMTRNVGLRFEGTAYFTLVESNGTLACTNGTCLLGFSGSHIWQGDVTGGLIFAF